ncbi:MAG: hypothetical protein KDK39_04020 [Leptospiraceae bacterium]|nr:hypothetical protein [Leptospiraceae bacterium]
MDTVYKLFDRLTRMIPDNILHMIRLGSLLVWLILATLMVYFAWHSGVQSAPELGQELSLSSIKEELAREQNVKQSGSIVLPDLADLVREKYKGATDSPQADRPSRAEANPFIDSDQRLLENPGPVDSYNRRDTQSQGPAYQGETLSPYMDTEYKPDLDQGSGGIRDASQVDLDNSANRFQRSNSADTDSGPRTQTRQDTAPGAEHKSIVRPKNPQSGSPVQTSGPASRQKQPGTASGPLPSARDLNLPYLNE